MYPFTDRTAAKLRPVIVVSGIDFNRGDDFVVLPLSSRVSADDPFGFAILETDAYFIHTRLRTSSSIKWTKPMTISSSVIEKRLGVVPPEVLAKIQNLVRTVFS